MVVSFTLQMRTITIFNFIRHPIILPVIQNYRAMKVRLGPLAAFVPKQEYNKIYGEKHDPVSAGHRPI